MGRIRLDADEFRVSLESKQDFVALSVAMKAVPGSDREEVVLGKDEVALDVENAGNVIALWSTGFEWDRDALMRGMDELIPHAYQHISFYSGTKLQMKKIDRNMMQAFGDKFKAEGKKLPDLT